MTEEFNLREAVRERINALYDCGMRENLKKRVPNRHATRRPAWLDGAS